MKLFTKEVKKIVIDECLFHCIIDQTSSNESISFKVYPSKTKTSYFLILFSWKVNWSTNLCEPSVCATLIKYAIKNGWDYTKEKIVMKIEQGDFLVKELRLES
ncbi:hypothetical protein [Paenibacillus sinopodophylli]|uniref:hypothetical protein n=1 Tax=Paenibacillus sinopodophylli TaxID=1837342 RepID=UPI00110C9309|nr:hypothetical protein [Paenibacillus sinopodophylli]